MTADGVQPSSQFPVDFDIFSDGGGEVSSTAAAACIVDDKTSKRRYRLVSYLGGATNNESEIFAGLMAFALVEALCVADPSKSRRAVQWFADSEYVLKSACHYIRSWQANGWKTTSRQPVKNQGLWRVYLDVSRGIEIIPTHVRGHSGHAENEECDSASTWVRNKGGDLLGGVTLLGDPSSGRAVSVQISGNKWTLFDARSILASFRNQCPAAQDISKMIDMISDAGSKGAERKGQIVHGTIPSTHYRHSDQYYLTPVMTLLRQAHLEAEHSKDRSPQLQALATKLHELIDEFS